MSLEILEKVKDFLIRVVKDESFLCRKMTHYGLVLTASSGRKVGRRNLKLLTQ
ncbi:hypothetical protein [Dapis sp. BLCC M172]|uniref:hypothetical protein n=1 Tax=Dapis sp. BLCC M172 TaxID=2975281 RepID=UPI003CF8180A